MNRKIVGMLSEYTALSQVGDWLWQQTPHPFGTWGNIQMSARHQQPDFLLLYNFVGLRKVFRKRYEFCRPRVQTIPFPPAEIQPLLRGVPKERIIFLWREPPLNEYQEDYKLFYQWAQEYCGYVSAPDDAAPIPEYMPAIWYHGNSFYELNTAAIPKKISPLSWICSGVNRSENHRKRLEFMQAIANSNVKLDIYGLNLPIWSNSLGSLNNKWYGMAPYYYNLTIENYAENSWYVTEKLWDALLAWCLPIYYGGPAADKLLPPGSFLRLPSLDAKGIEYIKEVTSTPDAWYAAKEAIAEARQIILHQLNLLEWLSNYVAKIS